MCAQRRLRSACASAQSDRSLRCPHEETLGPQLPIDQSLHCPHEETLGPQLPTEWTAKILIRLGICPGWSESSLGAQTILLVLSWGGSNSKCASLNKQERTDASIKLRLKWLNKIWGGGGGGGKWAQAFGQIQKLTPFVYMGPNHFCHQYELVYAQSTSHFFFSTEQM